MWLVLGYAEHCKFAFGKHCSGRKNQGKRKPADFFGHRNRKDVLDGPRSATAQNSQRKGLWNGYFGRIAKKPRKVYR